MKETRIMADPLKFYAALATSVVLVFLVLKSFELGHFISGAFFVLLLLAFVCIMYLYGAVLHMSQDGVRREFLFIPILTVTWDQIREIGVVGTKVFNGTGKKKKTGRRYIYISPEELTGEERFKMALEWPPRNGVLYCIYSRANVDAIQFFWSKPIAAYNAGDIFVNSIE